MTSLSDMPLKDRKIYTVLVLLSLASAGWLAYALQAHHYEHTTLCLFKNITGFPCPSCGITRSIIFLGQGDVSQAWNTNPLGIVAACLLVIVPIWIIWDLIQKDTSLARFFQLAENKIKTHKSIYIPLIVLVAINWGWNILKDL
jgi:hypothetical protein